MQNAHENDELEGWRGQLDKVAAVQQALAAGTYSVDAAKVANKVMDAMLGPAGDR